MKPSTKYEGYNLAVIKGVIMTNAKKQPYTGPQMKKAIATLQAVAAQQAPSSLPPKDVLPD